MDVERGVRPVDLSPADLRWQEHVVGPDTEPDPGRWRTRIVRPLA